MSSNEESSLIPIAPSRALADASLQEDCLHCLFLTHGAEGVATIDEGGRLRYLNPTALDLLGLEPGEAIGRRVIRFLDSCEIDPRDLIDRLRIEGSVRNLRARIRRPCEEPCDVQLTVIALLDGAGEQSGYLINCIDRTQEAWLREELRLRERRLQDLITSSADAVVGIDPEGRITSWNRGAVETYGYDADEVVGRKAVEVLGPGGEEVDGAGSRLQSHLSGDAPVRSWETTHRNKAGRSINVLVTLCPLRDQQGRRTGTSALVKDITELKRLEDELHRSERLAAVGQLSASIAHEVKNPLAAIRSAVEVLGESLSSVDSQHATVVHEVLEQIDRLDRLVKDLLSFARPSPPSKEAVALGDLIESTFQFLRAEPLREGVKIYHNFDPDLPLVRLDAGQFEQAFMNIILNALQAMEGQGTLTVTTSMRDDAITVEFRDTGPGLGSDVLDRLSQPFYTTKHRGTGLGLSIVQKVLEAHGARMEAQNDPEGRGAVFTIVLPRETMAAFPEHPAESDSSAADRNGGAP